MASTSLPRTVYVHDLILVSGIFMLLSFVLIVAKGILEAQHMQQPGPTTGQPLEQVSKAH